MSPFMMAFVTLSRLARVSRLEDSGKCCGVMVLIGLPGSSFYFDKKKNCHRFIEC